MWRIILLTSSPSLFRYEPAFQGDTILTYSINHARMRVLKTRMGILEIYHYVFARECFFYFGLGKASLCAEKALAFITFAESNLKRRVESGALMRSAQLDAVAATGEAIRLDSKTLISMIDLWSVTAVVRIARSYREHVTEQSRASIINPLNDDTNIYASQIVGEVTSQTHNGASISLTSSNASSNSGGVTSSIPPTSTIAKGVSRESSRSLCNLLQFAQSRFANSLLTRQESSLRAHRKCALDMALALTCWDDMHNLTLLQPVIFGAVPERPGSSGTSERSFQTVGSVTTKLSYSKSGSDQLEKLDDVSAN